MTKESEAKAKRQRLQLELQQIEQQIFELEASFLDDSRVRGNVLVGLGGFVAAGHRWRDHPPTRCSATSNWHEHLFSLSSLNSPVHAIAAETVQASRAERGSGSAPSPSSTGRAARRNGRQAKLPSADPGAHRRSAPGRKRSRA